MSTFTTASYYEYNVIIYSDIICNVCQPVIRAEEPNNNKQLQQNHLQNNQLKKEWFVQISCPSATQLNTSRAKLSKDQHIEQPITQRKN
jgi:hypothetical protein